MHLWSLAVEEQFYIVWPLIVLLFNRRNLTRIILLLIFFSIGLKCYYFFSGHSWQYTYFNTFARTDTLCIGALIAIAVRSSTVIPTLEKAVPYIFKILFVVLTAALLLFRPHAPSNQFMEPFGTTIFAIFFAALILYCLSTSQNSFTKRLLESKMLRFFGKYSYAMYIFHVPVLALLRPGMVVFFHKYMGNSSAFLLANFFCLAFTLIAGQISWYLIEKPALKLKRFFSYETKQPVINYQTEFTAHKNESFTIENTK